MTRILIFLCSLVVFTSCKKKFEATHHTSEEIGRYIAARIPAVIDINDPVRIRFAVQPDTSQTASVFEFNPSVKGVTYWEDNMTLAFKPDNGWQPGSSYQLQINLDRVIKDVDPSMKKVVFNFDVKPVKMNVSFEPLIPEFDGEKANYILRGRINTSAGIDSNQVRKAFAIKTSGKVAPTEWFHSPDGHTHEWVIAQIGPDSKLDFRWDGKSIGSKDSGNRTINVPRSDVLSVLSFEAAADEEKKIEIHFSQKLNPNQDLNGLVTINGSTDGFTIRKQDHILSIYPEESLITGSTTEVRTEMRTERSSNKLTVQLHPEITSSLGYKLGEPVSMDVSLSDSKPALRLVGTGVITPGHKEVIFPFEAINLKSVQVEVMRVFENNI